jgi:NADH:ubiquinone oxidoreductase subunit 6 (subunit J)
VKSIPDPSHHTSLFITRSSQTLVFVSFAITIYHRTQKELHQDTDAGKPTSRCFRSGRIILLVTIMINPSKTLRPGRKNTDVRALLYTYVLPLEIKSILLALP